MGDSKMVMMLYKYMYMNANIGKVLELRGMFGAREISSLTTKNLFNSPKHL